MRLHFRYARASREKPEYGRAPREESEERLAFKDIIFAARRHAERALPAQRETTVLRRRNSLRMDRGRIRLYKSALRPCVRRTPPTRRPRRGHPRRPRTPGSVSDAKRASRARAAMRPCDDQCDLPRLRPSRSKPRSRPRLFLSPDRSKTASHRERGRSLRGSFSTTLELPLWDQNRAWLAAKQPRARSGALIRESTNSTAGSSFSGRSQLVALPASILARSALRSAFRTRAGGRKRIGRGRRRPP